MKRLLIIALAFAILMITACAKGAGDDIHEHIADGRDADLKQHWRICKCGEKFDITEHSISNGHCTLCGSAIITYEDGTIELSVYNIQGDVIRTTCYDAEENIQYENVTEYSYGKDGQHLGSKMFSDGVLCYEAEFGHDADGIEYIAKEYFYNRDGTFSKNEYDRNGNTIFSASYNADGSVAYGNQSEYSADGSIIDKQYEGDRLVSENELRIDAEGNNIVVKTTYYNQDGSSDLTEYDDHGQEIRKLYRNADGSVESDVRYEHSYDADGNITLTKTFDNGRLVREMEFINGSDEQGSWSRSGKTTEYNEDGSKKVTDADPDGAWSYEISYDAQGNIIEELRYEYEFDENGDQTVGRSFKNGRLIQLSETVKDEEGETAEIIFTDYYEDGSREVRRYDREFTLIETVRYNANGVRLAS